jgi:hypothetical protein
MRQNLGIEVMRAKLLMRLVVNGDRSLEGSGSAGSVNVKVVANISRFNRENRKKPKNDAGQAASMVLILLNDSSREAPDSSSVLFFDNLRFLLRKARQSIQAAATAPFHR